MTKKKQDHLAQPITPDKWERQRNAERITLQDRKTVQLVDAGELANALGTRKVLFDLLGECLPLLKVDAEWSTDYEGKEAIEALIERIESARTAVQAEELPGATP